MSVLVLSPLPVCLQSRPCRETPSWSWRAAPWPLSSPGDGFLETSIPCPATCKTGPARAALGVCVTPCLWWCLLRWLTAGPQGTPPLHLCHPEFGDCGEERRPGVTGPSGAALARGRAGGDSKQRRSPERRAAVPRVTQHRCWPKCSVPTGEATSRGRPEFGMMPRALWDPPAP